jgi:hypothetical protein
MLNVSTLCTAEQRGQHKQWHECRPFYPASYPFATHRVRQSSCALHASRQHNMQ